MTQIELRHAQADMNRQRFPGPGYFARPGAAVQIALRDGPLKAGVVQPDGAGRRPSLQSTRICQLRQGQPAARGDPGQVPDGHLIGQVALQLLPVKGHRADLERQVIPHGQSTLLHRELALRHIQMQRLHIQPRTALLPLLPAGAQRRQDQLA